MKNIELTEEHKSKLLEMCVELFKEESEINSIQNFRISNNYILGLSDHTLYCENRDISDNHYDGGEVPEDELLDFYTYPINCFDINIHWFEFCLIHLAPKILNNSYGNNETSDLGYFGYGPDINENHPVDYLYEEFKKL